MLVNLADHRIFKFNSVLGSIITLLGEQFAQPSAAENNQQCISV